MAPEVGAPRVPPGKTLWGLALARRRVLGHRVVWFLDSLDPSFVYRCRAGREPEALAGVISEVPAALVSPRFAR